MFANHRLEELQARLTELFQTSPAKDIERNIKAALSAGFSRLDLVTREEFEIQSKLIGRMREKLAALESRVAALEAAAGIASRGPEDAARPAAQDPEPGG
jgi:ubiquinone biosynthesis accessory factor UbiK